MFIGKKIISAFLTTLMVFSLNTTIYAAQTDANKEEDTYVTKAAYVTNINNYGTNLISDIADNNSFNINVNGLSIKQTNDTICVAGNVQNQDFTVTGAVNSLSENGNVLYFSPKCTNTNFEILNLSYETGISNSAMYFKGFYKQNPKYDSMLKLYIKPKNVTGKNYILIEVFGYKMTLDDSLKSTVKNQPTSPGWNTKEFLPTSTSNDSPSKGKIVPQAVANTTFTETQTFSNSGYNETHTLTYRVHLDTSNMSRGGDGQQQLMISILGKTRTVPGASNLNSSTTSAIHIEGISLRAQAISGTAFFSSKIFGSVYRYASGYGSLGASISASYGPLCFNFYNTYQDLGYVDIDSTFTAYENGVNGNYARYAKVSMDSSFWLTQIGQNFGAILTTRDYANTSNSGTFFTYFDIQFINYSQMSSWSVTKELSTPLRVS